MHINSIRVIIKKEGKKSLKKQYLKKFKQEKFKNFTF